LLKTKPHLIHTVYVPKNSVLGSKLFATSKCCYPYGFRGFYECVFEASTKMEIFLRLKGLDCAKKSLEVFTSTLEFHDTKRSPKSCFKPKYIPSSKIFGLIHSVLGSKNFFTVSKCHLPFGYHLSGFTNAFLSQTPNEKYSG